MASVIDFGADPTGVADSTTAILNAIAATPVSGSVCFPYTATGGTYLCDADTLNAAGRRLQGDAAHATLKSTIKARTAGTALVTSSSECALDRLKIDTDGITTYGVHLTNADRSLLNGVEVIDATGWGFFFDECESMYCRGLFAQNNADGIRAVGCDNSEFYYCAANTNTNSGLFVAGAGSGLTANAGNIRWYGGAVDLNTAGPQVVLDGVEGALFSGSYVEGASPGVRMINSCFNNVLEYIRVVTGDAAGDFAFRLDSANKNTFIGCSAGGTNGRRIFIDEANAVDNTFVGCYRASYLSIDNMTLYFDDGLGTTWTCEQRQNGFVGASAPTAGTWRVGDVVWNNAAGVEGWRCTVAGAPGTWTAF